MSSSDFPTKTSELLVHLNKLETRIQTEKSKILVTGDVNVGKSTLVNSLLRQRIVPEDQQPCTSLFIELLDAETNNHSIEEIHALKKLPEKNFLFMDEFYSPSNLDSYIKFDRNAIHQLMDQQNDAFQLIKVFCKDHKSLLRNGMVDISIIDSPGLNIDTITTTSLFSKQQEIDVIVFVLSAENHMTQSGMQFLEMAMKEKSHIFIIVNRFDLIKNKEKCQREIYAQLKEILPETFQEAHSLVHFISAKNYLQETVQDVNPFHVQLDANPYKMQYEHMEDCLRTFLLQRRIFSKFLPVKTFIKNLVQEIQGFIMHEQTSCDLKMKLLKNQLELNHPKLEYMMQLKSQILDNIDTTIELTSQNVQLHSKEKLQDILLDFELLSENVEFYGIFYTWHYAYRLRDLAFMMTKNRIKHCILFARNACKNCVCSLYETNATMSESFCDAKSLYQLIDAQLPDEFNETQIPLISMHFIDIFGFYEQIGVLYGPLCALGVGWFGYKSLITNFMKQLTHFVGLENASKLLLISCSMAGIGLLVYTLADLKNSIKQKLLKNLKLKFQSTGFIDEQCKELALKTRRALRCSLWEFQSQFHSLYTENTRQEEEMNASIHALESLQIFHDSFIKKCMQLNVLLDELDIENE